MTYQKKENGFPKVIDIASLISIGGILLFNLGWIYWTSYFKTLQIDPSFIEIPFSKLLVTTWYYVLLVFSGFYLTFNYFIESKNDDKINVLAACWVILNSLLFICFWLEIFSVSWMAIIFCSISVLFISLYIVIRKKKIAINIMSPAIFKYILIVVIYVSSIYIYHDLGIKRANKFKKGYSENIELILAKDNSILIGKFITFMSNKYFILVKTNDELSIIIINDSEVLQAKIK